MPYVERSDEEIIAAYSEAFTGNGSDTDKVAFDIDGDIYTVREILAGLYHRESLVYELFIDNLRELCLNDNVDPLVAIRENKY